MDDSLDDTEGYGGFVFLEWRKNTLVGLVASFWFFTMLYY